MFCILIPYHYSGSKNTEFRNSMVKIRRPKIHLNRLPTNIVLRNLNALIRLCCTRKVSWRRPYMLTRYNIQLQRHSIRHLMPDSSSSIILIESFSFLLNSIQKRFGFYRNFSYSNKNIINKFILISLLLTWSVCFTRFVRNLFVSGILL